MRIMLTDKLSKMVALRKFVDMISDIVPRNVALLCSVVPGTFLRNLGTNYAVLAP